jgi:hypothetical protein
MTALPSLPVLLTLALAAFLAAVPTVLVVIGLAGPFIRKFLDENVRANDVALLKGAVKGAHAVIASFAARTPIPYDDALAQILDRAAREIEAAKGRPLTGAEKTRAVMLAESLLHDPNTAGRVVVDGGRTVVTK